MRHPGSWGSSLSFFYVGVYVFITKALRRPLISVCLFFSLTMMLVTADSEHRERARARHGGTGGGFLLGITSVRLSVSWGAGYLFRRANIAQTDESVSFVGI